MTDVNLACQEIAVDHRGDTLDQSQFTVGCVAS